MSLRARWQAILLRTRTRAIDDGTSIKSPLMPNQSHRNSSYRQNGPRPPPSDAALIIQALSPQLADATLPSIDRLVSPKPPSADAVDQAFDHILLKLIPELNAYLASLEGRDLGPAGNAETARALTRLVRRLGARPNGGWGFRCSTCGEAAVALRWGHSGEPPKYGFRLEHTPSRRHGTFTSLPRLELTRIAKTTP